MSLIPIIHNIQFCFIQIMNFLSIIRKLVAFLVAIFAILHVVDAQSLRGGIHKESNAVSKLHRSLRGLPIIASGASTVSGAIWRGLRGAMLQKPIQSPCANCVRSSKLPVHKEVVSAKPINRASQGPSILPSSAMPTAGSGKRANETKRVTGIKVATETRLKEVSGFHCEL